MIGYESGPSPATDSHLLAAVREGLKRADFVNGQDEQSDAWKLTVNLRAAAGFGLAVPLAVPGRAEVIE